MWLYMSISVEFVFVVYIFVCFVLWICLWSVIVSVVCLHLCKITFFRGVIVVVVVVRLS